MSWVYCGRRIGVGYSGGVWGYITSSGGAWRVGGDNGRLWYICVVGGGGGMKMRVGNYVVSKDGSAERE